MNVLGILKVVGTDAVKVGDDIVHVVEDIGHGAEAIEKLFATGEELAPPVKAGVTLLIADAEVVATSFLSAGSNPVNFVADAAAAAGLAKLVKDFIALLPVLKQAVGEIEADVAA